MFADDLRKYTGNALKIKISGMPQGLETLEATQKSLEAAADAGQYDCYLDETDSVEWELQKKIARYLTTQGLTAQVVTYRGRDHGLHRRYVLSWTAPIIDLDGSILED